MLRWFALVFVASLSILAEDPALIDFPDTWRFKKITASELQAGWNFPGYDDSTWPTGKGTFGTIFAGYGSWPDTTRLESETLGYLFRNEFNAPNPDGLKSLVLRIDYQHGFIAYLNGSEIARRNLPTNTTSFTVKAQVNHTRGPTEEIDISSFLPNLQTGTNLLAIHLTPSEASSEIAMAVELVANFTRGPFVQNASTNSIQVIWKTADITTGFVLYGKNQEDVHTILSTAASNTHAVTLTNLEPNQSYVYRVFTEKDGAVAAGNWYPFRTLKLPGTPIRFQVFADTGQLTPGQYNIASRMLNTPTDLAFHCGDVLYPYFIESQADVRYFSVYRDQIRSVPFFLAMGNHDGYYNLNDYLTAYYLPTNSATGTEIFYSFDHGDAHFVAVASDTQSGQRYHPGSPQYIWLENDLATSKQRWKFLFFHHVIRSSSLHSYDDYLFDGVLDKYALQMHIGGLAEKYKAQVIFNGHDHNYERFSSFNGVNSFVSGGGGASLYPQQLFEIGSSQYFYSHEFLDVTVDGPDLTIQALNENGAVLDRFYRSQESSTNYNSYWGTPEIETISGSDAGNIPGQLFNFSGPSIATSAGLWGNLGRIHIRNDSTNIYIGFEQAALHPNQVIALFLENPSAPGVSSLAGLGNNQIGGDVDGLDLLDRLAFKNFKPSIAALLGDEFADATSRAFQRSEMRWAAGQGVFHLDQNFTSIEDVRLQQFNRSPQVPVTFPESNADLIEIAIPRATLGNPTTNILLGAIIFSDPAEGPMEPQIDTAYAGRSFTAGNLSYLLEPLTVHLANSPFSEIAQFRATRLANNQIRFTWNSTLGGRYWIQQTPDITHPFQDIQNGFPHTATSSTTTLDLTLDENLTPPRFFRLRWE